MVRIVLNIDGNDNQHEKTPSSFKNHHHHVQPGVPAVSHAADGPDEESHGGGREEARVVPLRRRLPVLFSSLGLIFFSWPRLPVLPLP